MFGLHGAERREKRAFGATYGRNWPCADKITMLSIQGVKTAKTTTVLEKLIKVM